MKACVLHKALALASFLVTSNAPHAAERADIIVAADGSGQFRTIQAAINSIPRDNSRNVIVLIKRGSYNEKLFITTSHITLVGGDRDSTRIVCAELRSNWVRNHDESDWGSAVINIGDGVTDLILANLTVYNNYGSLHGTHDHQFAIRGFGATHIVLLYCNVISDGGDTVSLWNDKSGMYYHTNCYFEGWVDFVCPRGWCYITDSRFYGHNLSASIWQDGSKNRDQKFVVRYSFFDGVPGFPLGRHHQDAQIYLLDCLFSRNMADIPIYWPESANAVTWQWSPRHYYHNCHREGGDFRWHEDNLASAEGLPTADQITAKWTFARKWDPEGTMPSVLPFVSMPSPRDGAYDTTTDGVVLRWVPARNAESHNVYFWKTDFPTAFQKGVKLRSGPSISGKPVFVKNQKENTFDPGKLEPNTMYYWRIDEIAGMDTLGGPLWHFTTSSR